MRKTILSILLITSLLLVAGCGRSKPEVAVAEATSTDAPAAPEIAEPAEPSTPPTASTAVQAERQALLVPIAENIILPFHEQMVGAATALQEAAHTLQAGPTGPNLVATQEAWRAAASSWAKAEIFEFQFTMVLDNQIKKWPINAARVDEYIASGDAIDEAYIEGKGSNVKGLTAIEYLLFQRGESAEATLQTLVDTPARMDYLVALTDNLLLKTQALLALWLPDGENHLQTFIDSDLQDSDVDGSLNALINNMVIKVEVIERDKLGYPLKGIYSEARPDAVESPYAEYSMALILANLAGIQQTYDAGLRAYIETLDGQFDAADLTGQIDTQFAMTISALAAIGDPLNVAVIEQTQQVGEAWEEVKSLSSLFEVDMVNYLGLTITFSINDGD